MSQLSTLPDFIATCACSAPVTTPAPPSNPIVYYSILNGTPAAQSMVPANAGLPALAVEINGNGPGYTWNPQNAQWH